MCCLYFGSSRERFALLKSPRMIKTRDATIPFFQIRSDPIQKILSIGQFRSDPSTVFFFFFFLNQCEVFILLCHSFVC